MGRKTNSKRCSKAKAIKSSTIEEIMLPPTCYDSLRESRFSPDSLKSLRKELKDAINKIYSDYFSHFCKRKNSRIAIQNTLFLVYSEELVIEKNYCNELTQKVKQLVHLDSLNDIYFTFCKSLNNFMSKIHSQLQELRNSDPSVQLSCLLEAYFVVENSSKELGKVTSGIFDQKFKEFTCEQVTRQSFLDIVVKNFSGLIRNFKQAENPELFASAMRMEKELKGLGEKEGNLASAKLRKNDNSSPVIYCVDEIVNFINGDREEPKKVNGRKRRVSKASTADSSESPFPSTHDIQILLEEFPSTLDKEIEDFQNTLESTQPFEQKLKPSLSQEWLKNLRSQILKQ